MELCLELSTISKKIFLQCHRLRISRMWFSQRPDPCIQVSLQMFPWQVETRVFVFWFSLSSSAWMTWLCAIVQRNDHRQFQTGQLSGTGNSMQLPTFYSSQKRGNRGRRRDTEGKAISFHHFYSHLLSWSNSFWRKKDLVHLLLGPGQI